MPRSITRRVSGHSDQFGRDLFVSITTGSQAVDMWGGGYVDRIPIVRSALQARLWYVASSSAVQPKSAVAQLIGDLTRSQRRDDELAAPAWQISRRPRTLIRSTPARTTFQASRWVLLEPVARALRGPYDVGDVPGENLDSDAGKKVDQH